MHKVITKSARWDSGKQDWENALEEAAAFIKGSISETSTIDQIKLDRTISSGNNPTPWSLYVYWKEPMNG